jgi:hypothetical protein
LAGWQGGALLHRHLHRARRNRSMDFL